ncbi:MAG: hypothetical protein EHM28_01085 [Spirochaetaceae bacterium]|nr:MAG: hypothetical protein EHM28_01085 [Spirochaetaceae bacterium]
MKRKILILSLCIFCITLTAIFAQSNDTIDQLLAEQKATYGKSVLMVLSASNAVPITSTIDAAMKKLEESKWIIGKKAEDPITLGELSFIMMKAFNLSGGVMYAIAPGPRYACREFEFRGFILRNAAPDRSVTGEEVVQMLGKVLSQQEAVK